MRAFGSVLEHPERGYSVWMVVSSGPARTSCMALAIGLSSLVACSKGGVIDQSGYGGSSALTGSVGSGGGKGSSTSTGSPFPGCLDGSKNNDESDIDCGGSCPKCANGKACVGTGDCGSGVCTNGACVACTAGADCPIAQACVSGVCGACSGKGQCDAGQACVNGACGRCETAADCGSGKVCDFGSCVTGYEMQMYQCPASVSLGGGAWGFYGCQSQITNTSTCTEIEAPTTQAFACTKVGKLPIITGPEPAPPGTIDVALYQCPGQVTLGGGAWGYYGCQNQITNTSTCYEIEYPTQQVFNCMPIGRMSLAASPPAPPPGGQNVPMFKCPGVTPLGGGAWGYYGCQNQLTNVSSCYEIEAPTQQSFSCAAAGTMQLVP